jgi:hypothetical protein
MEGACCPVIIFLLAALDLIAFSVPSLHKAKESMSEEAAATTPPAEEPISTEEGKKESNNGGKQNKKDETPIEELYDLSQPIPKVRVVCSTFSTYLFVSR